LSARADKDTYTLKASLNLQPRFTTRLSQGECYYFFEICEKFFVRMALWGQNTFRWPRAYRFEAFKPLNLFCFSLFDFVTPNFDFDTLPVIREYRDYREDVQRKKKWASPSQGKANGSLLVGP